MTASFPTICISSFVIFLPFAGNCTAETCNRDGEKMKVEMEMVNIKTKEQ
jgi:hypothetical protein